MTTSNFELLETRQMMSATLVNGIVQVTGTAASDVISIDQTTQSLRVTINGVTQGFARSGVSGISVDAMGGADLVRLTPGKVARFSRIVGMPVSVPATISGGAGNDTLIGGNADDVISGGIGDDSIDGRAGNDTLWGNADDRFSKWNATTTTIKFGDFITHAHHPITRDFKLGDIITTIKDSSIWKITETDNDTIQGGTGNDKIHGNAGNDVLYAGVDNADPSVSDNDTLWGDDGDDRLDPVYYGDGAHPLMDGDHNLQMGGSTGNTTMYGGADNDTINTGYSTRGTNVANGDAGVDTIYLHGGKNVAHGGSENDKIYSYANGEVWVYGDDGADTIFGTRGIGVGANHLHGGNGNDIIHGTSGDGSVMNWIYGDYGQDSLYGGDGTNYVDGGPDNDYLNTIGGSLNDSLVGGAGYDTFWCDRSFSEKVQVGEAGQDVEYERDHGYIHRATSRID
jgi:Ca2+-binding RTX toxin-like protein